MSTPTAPLIRQLHHALSVLDDCPVECDGFARLATTVLTQLGIEHKVHTGAVQVGDTAGDDVDLPYHFWLICDSDEGAVLIDYRLRMWLGNEAPHGVMGAAKTDAGFEVGDYRYLGGPILMPVLPENLFDLLASPVTLKTAMTQAKSPVSAAL